MVLDLDRSQDIRLLSRRRGTARSTTAHTQDTFYFDAADFDRPAGINVFSGVDTDDEKDKLTADMCAAYDVLFAEGRETLGGAFKRGHTIKTASRCTAPRLSPIACSSASVLTPQTALRATLLPKAIPISAPF